MVNYDMMKEVRIYNREETISSISGAGENGQLNVKKNEIRMLANTIHKNKLKINHKHKGKAGHYKTEGNIGRTLFDTNHSNIFYDLLPRVMKIKIKISKWDLIKLKSSYTAKKTTNTLKKQPTEKTFTNGANNKRLIANIYEQLI